MKLDAVVIYTDRPLSVIKRQQPASLMTGGEERGAIEEQAHVCTALACFSGTFDSDIIQIKYKKN